MPKKLTKCPKCGHNDQFLAREVLWHEVDWDEDSKQFLLHKDLDNFTDVFVCQKCGKEINANKFNLDYC